MVGCYEELLVGIETARQDNRVDEIVDSAKDRFVALATALYE